MNRSDLVAARLRRRIRSANPSIDKETAREMTAELFDLIERARARWPGDDDLIQLMTRVIVDDQHPGDPAAADIEANAGMDLAIMLSGPASDGADDLYLRYRRLFDRINGTDLADDLEEPPAKKPELTLVRDDLPPLESLKQALIAAVRLAQSGEGPTKILDLLPEFKESAGIDFIMDATEAHRAALFDLVQKAGIPVES